jgi:hypothetical protein
MTRLGRHKQEIAALLARAPPGPPPLIAPSFFAPTTCAICPATRRAGSATGMTLVILVGQMISGGLAVRDRQRVHGLVAKAGPDAALFVAALALGEPGRLNGLGTTRHALDHRPPGHPGRLAGRRW